MPSAFCANAPCCGPETMEAVIVALSTSEAWARRSITAMVSSAVVTFASDVDSVQNFIALVANELIEWCDDIIQESEFVHRLNQCLAHWGVEVVVRALENKAETFRHEADLVSLTPAEEVKCDVTNAVVLRHAVHASLPSILRGLQTVIAFEILKSFCLVLLLLLSLLLALLLATAKGLAICIGKTYGIVEVEVGGKIPLAVVGIIATNVISMKR